VNLKKDFISLGQAAIRLREAGLEKSPRRIQELCQSGKIKSKKIGRLWYVDLASLSTYIQNNTPIEPEPIPEVVVSDRKNHARRYIFTAAQDNTPLHPEWWRNLTAYADHVGANISVAPYTYKRKSTYDLHMFDEDVQDYLVNNEIRLPGLRFCAQLNLSPTAVRPLSDLGTFTQSDWGIIPHPRIALTSVPTIFNYPSKMVMTTGSSTLPNYEHKKAGLKAEFHHIIGAILVEYNEANQFFCRQLIADDDGSFQDLTTLVKGGKIFENQRVEAITWGDVHLSKKDSAIFRQSFGFTEYDDVEGISILDILKPKFQFFHDLLDFEARNHHNILDPHHWAKMHYRKADSIEEEIKACAYFLEHTKRSWCQSVVVESNHDMALMKWLKTIDPRFDPVNISFYHKCQSAIYANLENDGFNIFDWVIRNADHDLSGIDFVDENGGYLICGIIECGSHGHRGVNGSRGSMAGFSRMAMKMNVGHSHSAGIMDGVYVAGVSAKLDMGYNRGASSWSHSHILTYPNSKRSIITLQSNGAWRA
jgi:hypothetical protein